MDPFTQEFCAQVKNLFNRVAEKQTNDGQLVNANWCPQRKLTLNQSLGIKYFYTHHDMTTLSLWEQYFERLADTQLVRSMSGVSIRFVLKEDTILNCESGIYDKTKIRSGGNQ